MSNKKDFTKSDVAINKFFTQPEFEEVAKCSDLSKQTYLTNDTKHTYVTNDTNHDNNTKHTHVSRHYEDRGKRTERFGLLMDKGLKDDLKLLTSATNSSSVNDLIVSVLVDYVNSPENKEKIIKISKILNG